MNGSTNPIEPKTITLDETSIVKCDMPGHVYRINYLSGPTGPGIMPLLFQNGAVQEVGGRNGWQNEEVLAILIDRMKYLNNTFSCRENAIVITKLEEALMWLEKRTKDRKSRGVEGKNLN